MNEDVGSHERNFWGTNLVAYKGNSQTARKKDGMMLIPSPNSFFSSVILNEATVRK
jgi:hypothetical protein